MKTKPNKDLKWLTEVDLFNWLKANVYNDLQGSKEKMSVWDCKSEKFKNLVELKCRRTHYPDLLIERKKYDSVTKKSNELGFRPVYICSTPNGIYGFYLDKVDLNWQINRKNPKTTDFSNNNKVEKEVAYIPLTQAQVIYESNKDTLR